MADLETFHAGLVDVLSNDAGLAAWASTHFAGASLSTLDGNRAIKSILETTSTALPLLLFEIDPEGGSVELDQRTLGNGIHEADDALAVVAIWHERNPASAFTQRVQLVKLMIQAVMADCTLGGRVDDSWVASWEPAAAADPEVHLMRFQVRGIYEIESA